MSVEAEIAEVVHQFGWYCVQVVDINPSFYYSIGLMETSDHPELIVFGLESRDALVLLSQIVAQIRAGERFTSAEIRTIHIGTTVHRIVLRRVDPTQHQFYLGYAMGYCRHIGRWGELYAMQIFWPDGRGKFPFDAGFDCQLSDLQPRLDVPKSRAEIEEFERQFE